MSTEQVIEDTFMDDLLNDHPDDDFEMIDNSDPVFIDCDITIKQSFSHCNHDITDDEFKVATYRANNKYDEYSFDSLIIERKGVANANAHVFISSDSIHIVKMPKPDALNSMFSFANAIAELTHFLKITSIVLTCNDSLFSDVYIKLIHERVIDISEQKSRFPGCYLDQLRGYNRELEHQGNLLQHSIRKWKNAFTIAMILLTISLTGIAIATAVSSSTHSNKSNIAIAPLPSGFNK